jgi:hypothetical protein
MQMPLCLVALAEEAKSAPELDFRRVLQEERTEPHEQKQAVHPVGEIRRREHDDPVAPDERTDVFEESIRTE